MAMGHFPGFMTDDNGSIGFPFQKSAPLQGTKIKKQTERCKYPLGINENKKQEKGEGRSELELLFVFLIPSSALMGVSLGLESTPSPPTVLFQTLSLWKQEVEAGEEERAPRGFLPWR